MGGSVNLGRLFGIRITAGTSWFLWLFLMVYILSGLFHDGATTATQGRAYSQAVIVTVIYVLALLGHEFGHALMARRFKIETERVELWMLGGFAHLSRESRTPKEEFWVAAAGPAVTLVVAVAAAVVVGSVEGFSVGAIWDVGSLRYAGTTAVSEIAGVVLFVEGLALVFNLLPALPLDGGRMARAVIWRATGSPLRATVATANAGRGLAMLLAVLGLYLLTRGNAYNAVWTFFLAWFIWDAAKAHAPASPAKAPPSQLTVANVVDAQPVWVSTTESVEQAVHHAFDPFPIRWAAALDGEGRLRGLLTAERARAELASGRASTPVSALLEPGRPPSTRPTVPLDRLLRDKDLERLGALAVVDGAGVMVGVVSREQARQALVVERGLRD